MPIPASVLLAQHLRLLCNSYRHWTGSPLPATGPALSDEELIRRLAEAPFALLSHDTAADPVFNYANRYALRLFGMSWQQLVGMPSRFSAEAMQRDEREQLLRRVASRGYVDDYRGTRIAKSGRRFIIQNATVWNLLDAQGRYYGQAAMFRWP